MEAIFAIVGILGLCGGIAVAIWALKQNKSNKDGSEDELKALMQQVQAQFRAAASEALQANQQTLALQAKEVVENAQKISQSQLQKEGLELQKVIDPLKKNLTEIEQQIREIEKSRVGSFSALDERLKELALSQSELRGQTGSLVQALREPKTRGSWGELQLKRAVEFAGMTEYVDFNQQVNTTDSENNRLQPDMIIRMPSKRVVVVDAKVSLAAYLESVGEQEPTKKREWMVKHATQLRTHFKGLSKKEYYKQFAEAPEFVVLFLNTESSLAAALEVDPRLIEDALTQKVLIATPTNLIALLHAVSYGWAESQSAENAKKIVELGIELEKRINVVLGHWQKVGDNLNKSVAAFNSANTSVERNLKSTARKLNSEKDITELSNITERCVTPATTSTD